MTEDELKKDEQEWLEDKKLLRRKEKLKADKREFRAKYKKKIPTSKLIVLFLFINCTMIELFTCAITVYMIMTSVTSGITPDYTPLVTLIGCAVSEVIGFAIYALKAMKENTAGGIEFESTMALIKSNIDSSTSEEGGPVG